MPNTINRRDFITTSTLAAFAASSELTAAKGAPGAVAAALDENMPALTAVEAVTAIRRGDIRAENYAKTLISRAERLVDLHSYIALNRDRLIESARAIDTSRRRGRRLGRLAGLPLLVKDNIDTQALPTTAGTRSLANNRPGQDALVLTPLFSAGALLMAKMNLHELAAGITSTNAVYGAVRNPYAPKLIPGGSSGGTAAAIAARIAPAGLGTDTGGSMRIPPALCGVVGLRPTVANGRKRYSTQGVVPISHTWDTVGSMGRSVEDVALLDSVITSQTTPRPVTLKGLRLGVPRRYFWENLDGELADVAESALEKLRSAGAVLVDVDMGFVREHNLDAIPLYEIEPDITNYLAAAGGNVSFNDLVSQIASKDVAGLFALAKTIPKTAYDTAIATGRPQLQELYADSFRQHAIAALVFPTTVLPARPINEGGDIGQDTVELNGAQVTTFQTYARNTSPSASVGLPGLTLPAGLTKGGLPVGIEFDGLIYSDRELLGIGMSVETLFGTIPPPKI